jgi:protein TonB
MVTHETLNNPGRFFGTLSFSTILHVAAITALVVIPATQIPIPYPESTQNAEFEITDGGSESRESSMVDGLAGTIAPAKAKSTAPADIPAPVVSRQAYQAVRPSMVLDPKPAPFETPSESVKAAPVAVATPALPQKQIQSGEAKPVTQLPESTPSTSPVAASPAPMAKEQPVQATTVAALPIQDAKPAPGELASSTQSGAVNGIGDAPGAPSDIKEIGEVRQMAGNVPPSYPPADRLTQREGQVSVLAFVGTSGQVNQVLLENSNGSEAMNQSVMQAVRKYRFQPGQPSWVRVPFQFSLRGAAEEAPSTLRR